MKWLPKKKFCPHGRDQLKSVHMQFKYHKSENIVEEETIYFIFLSHIGNQEKARYVSGTLSTQKC